MAGDPDREDVAVTLALMPYQAEGARFLATRERAMLFDEPGLGKTPQAIRAADECCAHRIVVICPAIARVMWQRQFAAWSEDLHSVAVYSYEGAVKQPPQECDLLILDEAHYVKNPSAARTVAIYGYRCQGTGWVAKARRVWLLTGTPTPNGGHELYSHLRARWPEVLTVGGRVLPQWEWIERNFHTWSPPGTERLIVQGPKPGRADELRAALAPYLLRRLKKDVLPQLPPLRTEVVVLPQDAPGYDAGDRIMIEAALDALERDEDGNPKLPISALRSLTGTAKIKPSATFVRELLAGGEQKVVVFAHHNAVVDALADELAEFAPVFIRGGQTDKQRQHVIDRFQSDPNVRVVIGQITACNTAIDLSAASREVFVEWSWNPAENAQAAQRAHRFTTRSAVIASFLSLRGSLDEALARVVERKLAATAALWSENHAEPVRNHRSGIPAVPAAELAGVDFGV